MLDAVLELIPAWRAFFVEPWCAVVQQEWDMSLASFCDVMALIRKRPRDIEGLMQVTGMSEGAMHSYTKLLHDEGHIYVLELKRNPRGSPTPVYAWQDEVFGLPDARAPVERR